PYLGQAFTHPSEAMNSIQTLQQAAAAMLVPRSSPSLSTAAAAELVRSPPSREVLMNTLHVVVASWLLACLGPPAAADAPGAADRLTIRFNGFHEVLRGGEDPLKLGIGPGGSLRRGTLTYCVASFEGPGADRKAAARRRARDILGADRFPIEVEFP